MSTEDKVQLLLWVDAETNTKFRQLIQQKYNQYERGLLSYEGNEALKQWVLLHTKTHKFDEAKVDSRHSKIRRVYEKVKRYIHRNYYGYEGEITGRTVPMSQVRLAVMNIRGSDDRTIKKWIERFDQNNLIRLNGVGSTVELIA